MFSNNTLKYFFHFYLHFYRTLRLQNIKCKYISTVLPVAHLVVSFGETNEKCTCEFLPEELSEKFTLPTRHRTIFARLVTKILLVSQIVKALDTRHP